MTSRPVPTPRGKHSICCRVREHNARRAAALRLIAGAVVALGLASAFPAAAQPAGKARYADEKAAADPAFESRLVAELEAVFGEAIETGRAPVIARDKIPPRHATLLLRDLRLNYSSLSPETQARYAPLLLRPSVYGTVDYVNWGPPGTYTQAAVSSSRFIVHYVTAPSDNPSTATPAFAQQVLDSLEYTADVENGSLQWPPPPSDSFYTSGDNGGDGRYDIYLADVGGIPGNPLFGYIMAEQQVAAAPGASFTSYMVLDNDFSPAQFYAVSDPIALMRVTVAHEYNHSCQYGLDANDPETWFYESTATHSEEIVYNSVNDYYRYLPGFFDWPDVSLRYFPASSADPARLHPYGAAVWNHYLARRFGDTLEVDIWEDAAVGLASSHPTLLQTMQARLASLGTSLPDEFGRFAAWNVLTGARANSTFYPEGAAWPEVFVPAVQQVTALPDARDVPDTEGPQPLAASYILITAPPAAVSRLRFDFQGQGDTDWRLWWVARKNTEISVQPVALDPADHAVADIDNPQDYDWIAFVPSNVSTSDLIDVRAPFSYQVTQETSAGAAVPWFLAP